MQPLGYDGYNLVAWAQFKHASLAAPAGTMMALVRLVRASPEHSAGEACERPSCPCYRRRIARRPCS